MLWSGGHRHDCRVVLFVKVGRSLENKQVKERGEDEIFCRREKKK